MKGYFILENLQFTEKKEENWIIIQILHLKSSMWSILRSTSIWEGVERFHTLEALGNSFQS